MAGVCDDLRIIDLSSSQAAGIATMVLADFGADVIKVEPAGGDRSRALAAAPMLLRGKRSVTLDLRSASGQASLRELVLGADVLVASYRPGEAAEHGADFAGLSALNPRLVYCSVTGWGPRGPYAHYPDDEALVAAKSGRMWSFANIVRRDGPGFPAVQVGAHAAAQSAIAGILAALHARGRDGRGQLVETSLLQGMFPYDLSSLTREQMLQRHPELFQNDLQSRYNSPDVHGTLGYQPILGADGRWIQCANLLEHLFISAVGALDLTEEVLANPRYAGRPNALPEDAHEEVRNLILARARERPADEWMRLFRENGNVAADHVGTAQQALSHADLLANGEVIDRASPKLGTVRQLGPLAQLRATPAQIGGAASAEPGQHTAEVLAEPPRSPAGAPQAEADGRPPFDGITVLEFATIIAAPLAAALLADMGARVIKVEPVEGGDPMRGLSGIANPINSSLTMAKTTAGKESICVDLKSEAGQAIVRQLIAKADVIVHNYRPGVPERLGIGYEQARAIRPDVIWVSVSGYGPEGPGALRPAAHPIPGAVCGGALMQVGEGWPRNELDSIDGLREASRQFFRANEANPDPNTSVVVAAATSLALHARRRTGQGQQLFVSMLCANGYANADDFLSYAGKPERPSIDGWLFGTGPLRRLYRASDGWVCLSVPDDGRADAAWTALCETAGRPEIAGDPRFHNATSREAHRQELAELLTELFATRGADEWERRLIAAGVGCVRADSYPNVGQFYLRDEQMSANGFATVARHTALGEYQRWGPMVTFSATPGRYGTGVLAGEQSDAILAELGYDRAAIAALRERGAVWSDPAADDLREAAAPLGASS
jgi:crotonobetainyl-CoA:carnitine CoA-transferase CaiB-like acyl-CoA transferase